MNWEKALITFPKLYPPQRSRGIKIWQKLWRGGTAMFRSRWLLQAVASSRASDGSESFIRGQYRLERRLPWASVQECKGRSKNRTLPASDFSRVRTEQGNRAASGRIQLVNAITAESAAWPAAAGAALAIDSRVSCLRVLPPARLL